MVAEKLMRGIVAQLGSLMLGPLQQHAREMAREAGLGLVALLLVTVAFGFFNAAMVIGIDQIFGPVTAALVVGSAFLSLALIVVATLAWTGRAARRGRPDLRGSTLSAAGLDLRAGLSRSPDGERDQAALLEGLLIASQLKPYELVSLAVVAGFLLGRRSRSIRPGRS
jgi:hypothetical protein